MAEKRGISNVTYIFVLLLVVYFASTQETQLSYSVHSMSMSMSYSSSTVDINNRNPCSFRGSFLLHNQATLIDPCTRCVCDNGTTSCRIESCPSRAQCEAFEIVVIPEECCPQCPFEMVIDNITGLLITSFKFTEGGNKKIKFSLDIAVSKRLSSKTVRGENLWKLSAWISPKKDGSGRRYSFEDNIFNKRQAAKEYSRKDYPPWVWSTVKYNITFTGGTCEDYKYFCVKFSKADHPRPKYGLLFKFHPVNDDEERLIACMALGECTRGPSVLKSNPNGTITIELPSQDTQGSTGFTVGYRRINTTSWITKEYADNEPKLLTGNFEQGVTYELRISLSHGGEYRDPEIFETFTIPCEDIHITLALSTATPRRYGRASIIANWHYPNRTSWCSVTRQTISVNQIDLDDCDDQKNPLNETAILKNDERHYKQGQLRANTEYNVTVTVEEQQKSYVTWELIRTFETVPTSPPDGVSSSSNTKSGRLLIRWNNLPCCSRNAGIVSYVIELKDIRGIRVHNFKTTGASYAGFKIGEPYYFRVAAMNSKGIGPFSPTFGGRFGVR